jgi:hypothetical protein
MAWIKSIYLGICSELIQKLSRAVSMKMACYDRKKITNRKYSSQTATLYRFYAISVEYKKKRKLKTNSTGNLTSNESHGQQRMNKKWKKVVLINKVNPTITCNSIFFKRKAKRTKSKYSEKKTRRKYIKIQNSL